MTNLLILLAAIWLSSLAYVLYLIATAPYGVENETGFRVADEMSEAKEPEMTLQEYADYLYAISKVQHEQLISTQAQLREAVSILRQIRCDIPTHAKYFGVTDYIIQYDKEQTK